MTLDDIPREDLIAMLKERVWNSCDREEFGARQGFSCEVSEESAVRDVVYRKAPLFKTPEEAILACWQRHYAHEFSQLESNLLNNYRIAVIRSANSDSLEEITATWAEMVKFCDDSLEALPREEKANFIRGQLIAIKAKCERLQGMHT